jgi:hypothetical protein
MRWIRNFGFSLILMWCIGGCLKQPENSIIPSIQFQSVSFKHEMPKAADTLIITLKFTDGDGDLGVNGDETAIYTSPSDSTDITTPFYYIYDSAKNTTWYYSHYNNITLPKGYKYVNYASYRTIHTLPFDTLPGTLNCKNWELRVSPADTLYIQQNPYAYNLFMDVYTKNPDGSYTLFDPSIYFTSLTQCSSNVFDGRFPILSSDLGKKSSLDGTITYKYQSAALYLLFHSKTLKIKVYILDRAFHKSNVAESDDFTIN